MGFEVAAVTALGLLGGVSAYESSRQQNKAAKRSADSARRSAAVQSTQERAKADQDRQRQLAERRRVQAAVLASAADTGFSTTSSDVDSILTGYRLVTEDAIGTIDDNLRSNLAFVDSQLESSLAIADSRRTNSLFSGFSGVMQGATTGLTLAEGFGSLGEDS